MKEFGLLRKALNGYEWNQRRLRAMSSRIIPAIYIAAFTSFATATGKAALLRFSVAVLLAGGAAAVRGQSALDGFDPNTNGTVRVVVFQPDGKILIGVVLGHFRSTADRQ